MSVANGSLWKALHSDPLQLIGDVQCGRFAAEFPVTYRINNLRQSAQ